ncbi:uncharacterized protein TNIN_457011 [Trichonephila inaurata madagascariensis]|uniref:Uncharacterized protein n=1 Tax=Trichonephila inaurata madagascariensis TaxID=2747483 RepID=A0A8X6X3B3_9ARAC|nr:uncharacterized protein TNIN_457011 [Trichonephila inaurata madagascariensis]
MTQTTLQRNISIKVEISFRNAYYSCILPFQYIPHEVFLKNRYTYFTLKNCILVDILDDEITGLAPLNSLILLDLKIQKKITWRNFSNMKRMTLLHVENTVYKKIKLSDTEWLSRKLVVIYFVNTKTLRIAPNAFKEFKKLESLTITKNNIKRIESNMFPENLLQLVLTDNKIKSIPSDLSDALSEKKKNLENNRIFPFAGPLKGNPVKCVCASKWVIGRKKPYIEGTCADWKDKKNIRDLEPKDFIFCPQI